MKVKGRDVRGIEKTKELQSKVWKESLCVEVGEDDGEKQEANRWPNPQASWTSGHFLCPHGV